MNLKPRLKSSPDDGVVVAVIASVTISAYVLSYWVSQVISTLELLELAYGAVKFFNNPLVF
ncbi:MAG: hypothetical protein COC19_05530 [SAR86 cluster bacterium]|uniref:Uncharacterized protein n=1 Tax=SAR86 cluster bacterium TaxID=2030880 RepID=A0A2A4MM84_9GAMM|nr:MAG: hypothetical protein COC19_05530 [SAR86 cluster bacterium]